MCWFGSWSMWLSLFGRVGCEGSLSCREGWHEVLIPWLLFLDVGAVKGAPLSSLVRWWWFFWIFFLAGLEGRMLHRAALISDHRVKVLHSDSWISWWNGTWLISHRFTQTSAFAEFFRCKQNKKKAFLFPDNRNFKPRHLYTFVTFANSSARVCHSIFSFKQQKAPWIIKRSWPCRPLLWWCRISWSSVYCRWCKRSCWWQAISPLWKSGPRSLRKGFLSELKSNSTKKPVRSTFPCIYIYIINELRQHS